MQYFLFPSQSHNAIIHCRTFTDYHERKTDSDSLSKSGADHRWRFDSNFNRNQLWHGRADQRFGFNARLQFAEYFFKKSFKRHKNPPSEAASRAWTTFVLPFPASVDFFRHVECTKASVDRKFLINLSF